MNNNKFLIPVTYHSQTMDLISTVNIQEINKHFKRWQGLLPHINSTSYNAMMQGVLVAMKKQNIINDSQSELLFTGSLAEGLTVSTREPDFDMMICDHIWIRTVEDQHQYLKPCTYPGFVWIKMPTEHNVHCELQHFSEHQEQCYLSARNVFSTGHDTLQILCDELIGGLETIQALFTNTGSVTCPASNGNFYLHRGNHPNEIAQQINRVFPSIPLVQQCLDGASSSLTTAMKEQIPDSLNVASELSATMHTLALANLRRSSKNDHAQPICLGQMESSFNTDDTEKGTSISGVTIFADFMKHLSNVEQSGIGTNKDGSRSISPQDSEYELRHNTQEFIPDAPVHTTNSASDLKFAFDFVHALSCLGWPELASGWVSRNRQWPSENVVDTITSSGFNLVPKMSPGGNADLDWRISFSKAELILAEHMNETQKNCYRLFKSIVSHKCQHPKTLASYHLKTVFMWTLERIPERFWTKHTIGERFLTLMDTLIQFVAAANLPMYFIPDLNLLDGIDNNELNITVNQLIHIRKHPLEYPEQSQVDFIEMGKRTQLTVMQKNHQLLRNIPKYHFLTVFKQIKMIDYMTHPFIKHLVDTVEMNDVHPSEEQLATEMISFIIKYLAMDKAKLNNFLSECIAEVDACGNVPTDYSSTNGYYLIYNLTNNLLIAKYEDLPDVDLLSESIESWQNVEKCASILETITKRLHRGFCQFGEMVCQIDENEDNDNLVRLARFVLGRHRTILDEILQVKPGMESVKQCIAMLYHKDKCLENQNRFIGEWGRDRQGIFTNMREVFRDEAWRTLSDDDIEKINDKLNLEKTFLGIDIEEAGEKKGSKEVFLDILDMFKTCSLSENTHQYLKHMATLLDQSQNSELYSTLSVQMITYISKHLTKDKINFAQLMLTFKGNVDLLLKEHQPLPGLTPDEVIIDNLVMRESATCSAAQSGLTWMTFDHVDNLDELLDLVTDMERRTLRLKRHILDFVKSVCHVIRDRHVVDSSLILADYKSKLQVVVEKNKKVFQQITCAIESVKLWISMLYNQDTFDLVLECFLKGWKQNREYVYERIKWIIGEEKIQELCNDDIDIFDMKLQSDELTESQTIQAATMNVIDDIDPD